MADHHVGQGLLIGVLRLHVADVFALAEDGLMQLVRDDDEGFAVGLHVAHDLEQLVRLLRRENGGRLVEDQDVGAAIEHLDDLDGLLLRDGHVIDLLVGVDVKAVPVADLPDLFG